uniref:Uncharacterized protein n=1 Tax=Cajanus cajan TaxID=3821 RepID=A0A151RA25_CAJCA|nr:hypothetical protein KK1_039325 [Cajanus cajan]
MSQLKKVGKEDPRRVVHSLKVALAITVVSLFYYVKPLYNGFGSSAMWVVFTIFEFYQFDCVTHAGATLGKGFNRGFATFLAGAMGLGSYYMVNSMSMGHIVEPILLGALIFLISFGEEYFRTSEVGDSNKSFLQGYKSVLNSKQVEENLANFARWEPCDGGFRYGHPWQQYLKIGNLSRQCAYRIDALNGFLNSTKTLIEIRSKIQESCMKMSTETGKALKKLAVAIHKMIPPSSADTHIAKSKVAATSLRSIIKTGLWEETNLFDVIPVLTVASLLVDVVSYTERLAYLIQELATLAKFENNILP